MQQVVVPNGLRNKVMALAHDSILGGHLGTKRTVDKVLSNFFWPGVGSDVKGIADRVGSAKGPFLRER